MISIADIRAEYAALSEDERQIFINKYAADTRSGVAALVKKAEKALLSYEKEKERTRRMYYFERKYEEYSSICGIDEVGRGPLAGPVCAAAVILPSDKEILYLNDSKKLSEKKREELYDVITKEAVAWSVAMVDEGRIDEVNILQATYEAMEKAVRGLKTAPDLLLIDAVHVPALEDIKQVSIVKGDTLSASIAAASIVAKVTRDRLMKELDGQYPGYGLSDNKGYGSAAHIEALRSMGPSKIHRRSFIKGILEDNTE